MNVKSTTPPVAGPVAGQALAATDGEPGTATTFSALIAAVIGPPVATDPPDPTAATAATEAPGAEANDAPSSTSESGAAPAAGEAAAAMEAGAMEAGAMAALLLAMRLPLPITTPPPPSGASPLATPDPGDLVAVTPAPATAPTQDGAQVAQALVDAGPQGVRDTRPPSEATAEGTADPTGPAAPAAPTRNAGNATTAVDTIGGQLPVAPPATSAAPAAAPAAPAAPASAGSAAGVEVSAPAVVRQVVPEVTRLISNGAGVHRVTLQLTPEALGEVRVVLTIRDGSVHVRLAAGDAAQQALLEGAPELRRLLETAGAGETRIVVRDLPSGAAPGVTVTAAPTGSDGDGSARHESGQAGSTGHGTQDRHAGTRAGGTARDGTDDGANPPRLVDQVTRTRSSGVDVTV